MSDEESMRAEVDRLRRVIAGFAYSGKTNPKDRGHYFGCHWSVTGTCAVHCQAARAVMADDGGQ